MDRRLASDDPHLAVPLLLGSRDRPECRGTRNEFLGSCADGRIGVKTCSNEKFPHKSFGQFSKHKCDPIVPPQPRTRIALFAECFQKKLPLTGNAIVRVIQEANLDNFEAREDLCDNSISFSEERGGRLRSELWVNSL